MISLNNQSEKVIAVNEFFYVKMDNARPLVCCDEYQDTMYCFKSDTAQGCQFCEFDPYSACECEDCECD